MALIILAFAFVFECIAAFWQPSPSPRVHFGWLGVAFLILYLIVGGAAKFL